VPPETGIKADTAGFEERTLDMDHPFEPASDDTVPPGFPSSHIYSKEDGPGGFFPIMARTVSRGDTAGPDQAAGRTSGFPGGAGGRSSTGSPSDDLHSHWQYEAALLAGPAKGARHVPGSSKGKASNKGFFGGSPTKINSNRGRVGRDRG